MLECEEKKFNAENDVLAHRPRKRQFCRRPRFEQQYIIQKKTRKCPQKSLI